MTGTATPAAARTTPEPAAQSHRVSTMRRFLSDRMAVAAVVYLVLLILAAVFAPVLAPADPIAQDLAKRLTPPDGTYLLGTDDLGRDQLSRLLYGARVSLLAALEAVAVGVVVGVPLGALAGYVGGRVDTVIGRVMDSIMSIPGIMLALTAVAVLGRDITIAMMAIGVVLVPQFQRLVRASTQALRNETFVEASRTIGCSRSRILLRHILPNVLPVLVVQMSVMLGVAVTAEASLSFLGVGVQPPAPSWGSMLNNAVANTFTAPYLIYPPGLAITLTVLALALVGDGLRKATSIRRRSGEGR
ncbi:peptide/nickel transport system permease protein [Pseudonocardia thermophila]|jgi:ABC-type dipeptide/oligopeptide/nickel transport systems, permease components|uniref:Peptide/nickel transport system permease protein n=1 Tax=Pseudonocardia thermophila TaxID=1848 RepID=A0A1M6XQQ1_PSETH|nr:ABC transporter permease [Pseudonocardia thermophila]SHL08125.1 peptide/nickel transport system permease protein [Pseudonocardia thermophila]